MARNRYHKDYELLESFDEKGRIKKQTRYIGKKYVFTAGQEEAKRQGRRVLCLLAAAWMCFISAMFPDSMAMRTLYVALPFVFTAPVLVISTDLCLTILNLQTPMERRHAEKMENRYPPVTLFLFLFPLFALVGDGIRVLSGGKVIRGDLVFLFFAGILAVAGISCFSLRKAFAVKALEQ